MKATAQVQSIVDGVAYITVQAGSVRFGFSADAPSILSQEALDAVVLAKLQEQIPAPQPAPAQGETPIELAEGQSIDVDVPADLAALVPA